MLKLRLAGTDDIDTIIDFRLAVFRETGTLPAGVDISELCINLREYMETKLNRTIWIWLAERNGEVLGTAAFMLVEKPPAVINVTGVEGYILNVYTVPAHRGEGIASRLMEEIMAFAKEKGANRIRLHATDMGRQVYTKLGFLPSQNEMIINTNPQLNIT